MTGTAFALVPGRCLLGERGRHQSRGCWQARARGEPGTGAVQSNPPLCFLCHTQSRLEREAGIRKGQVTTVPSTHDVFMEDALEGAMTGMDRERRRDRGLRGAHRSPVELWPLGEHMLCRDLPKCCRPTSSSSESLCCRAFCLCVYTNGCSRLETISDAHRILQGFLSAAVGVADPTITVPVL